MYAVGLSRRSSLVQVPLHPMDKKLPAEVGP